jgi:uncharacterized protein YqcC (DUF446 family)
VFALLDSWGWNRLILLSELERLIGDDGGIKLKIGIRPETYQEAVKAARSQSRLLNARMGKIEGVQRAIH